MPAQTYYFLRINNNTSNTIKLIRVSALPLVPTMIGNGLKYHNANSFVILLVSFVTVISINFFNITPHRMSEKENKYFPKLKKYF